MTLNCWFHQRLLDAVAADVVSIDAVVQPIESVFQVATLVSMQRLNNRCENGDRKEIRKKVEEEAAHYNCCKRLSRERTYN